MSEVAPDQVNRLLLRASLRGLELLEGVDDTIEQLADGIQLRTLATGETLQRLESLLSLARTLVDRVDRGDRRSWSPVRTIAVLPAGSTPPERVQEVLDQLAETLAQHGATAVLASGDAATAVGAGSGAVRTSEFPAPALRAWVDRVEHEHQHVLLDGTEESAWTDWCLRFADVVLVVGASGADTRPSPVERGLWTSGEAAHHVELVVVHGPSTTKPKGTASWLANRQPAGVHHVRRGHAGDHARLGRLITGRGIGLVLGGGGPRGFAHLGVMQALDEAGVQVDLVGGTSIGSIMGAFLAQGLDHDQRMRAAVSAFVRPHLIRYTLPLVSLSSARQVTAGLRDERNFGSTQIEDLSLRYLCVSVDLVTGEEVVHESGPVWLATRASISLPAVFPPVMAGDRLLTDGGILNNIPVDHVADRLAGGTLIAVDLEHAAGKSTVTSPFPPDLSGWTVLRDRLAPWRPTPRVPGPIETLLRARSAIASRVQRDIFATTPPDVLIQPRLGTHGLVDFQTAPHFVEAGYRATVEALDRTPIPTS